MGCVHCFTFSYITSPTPWNLAHFPASTFLTLSLLFFFLEKQIPFLSSLAFLPFPFSFSFRSKKMPINKDPSTPAPMIGKIGPYTVFMTPPSTPSPKPPPTTTTTTSSNESTLPVFDSPKKAASPPPPVQPPPQQIDKSVYSQQISDGSVLGFFKNAVNKVQNAHSSLDDHLARWLGLNQSKYQWALDDYYETKGLEKEGAKAEEISSKILRV